jgi:hypothetical protein
MDAAVEEGLTIFMGEVSQLHGMSLVLEERHEPSKEESLSR